MPPLLSIITPSLNQAKYLPDCLRSVREQGVTMATADRDGDIEHIVIDGGSTDGSTEIIANAPGLAWSISEPDRGQSDAINKGMAGARARGEWATWLNADDWLEPGALPRMLAALRADPAIDVLVGRCRFVDLEGRTIFDPRPPEPINLANLLRLRSQWFHGRLIVQPEAFFRLSLFREVGGLNTGNHYTMDHELWLRLLRAGARFETIDTPVACMRSHPEQKTADNTRIVRCMLQFARPIHEAARADGSLGAGAAEMGAELDAMQRKLADADLINACWDALERRRAAPAGASAHDDLEARWSWRALPSEALELAAPHVRAALRHAQAGGDVTVLDPSGGGVLNTLAPKLVEPPRSLLRRPQRSQHVVSSLAELQSLAPESIDGAITCCALAHLDDPGAALELLWGAMRPGAPLLLLAETIICPDLPAYLAHLRALMSVQLSQNHDTLISPEAALWISRLRGHDACLEDAAASWARAHPSAQGVDLGSAADAIGAHVELARRYGGLWYHPLAPFPELERDNAPAADSWLVAVWRKPKEP